MRGLPLIALACMGACAAPDPALICVDDAYFEVVDAADGEALTLRLADAPLDAPDVAGVVRRVAGNLRFVPRFPLAKGVRYRLAYGDTSRVFELPPPDPGPRIQVTSVYPSGDVLPENVLRFYVQFSGEVARGQAYDHIQVRDGEGRRLALPFLEIAEELWDTTGTRLTLLIDPGRIKNELRPRLEDGPVFESGNEYRLEIRARWPDIHGRGLASAFTKRFRTRRAEIIQPAPGKWQLSRPRLGTKEPLTLRFEKALDHALLGRMIDVVDARGPVAGAVEIGRGERTWTFRPESPWSADHRVEVDVDLEDVAGNSIRAPFEVDVFRRVESVSRKTVTLAIPFAR